MYFILRLIKLRLFRTILIFIRYVILGEKLVEKKNVKKRSGRISSAKLDSKINSQKENNNFLGFLEKSHPSVRNHLAASTDLKTFLDSAGTLSIDERKKIVEQSIVLVSENFVHLQLKESMHGINPIQKLRLIQHDLDQLQSSDMSSEFKFHSEMVDVFNSVRDLHTNYLLPAPFSDKVAFLPFQIEEYFVDTEPHYIATHFVQGFSHPHFKRGVEIKVWNGVPISRAIDVSADMHAGSNLAARHVRGIDGLTIRALRSSPPPDAMWVIVGYTDLDGVDRELKQDWIVTPSLPNAHEVDAESLSENAASQGIDLEAYITQQAKKMLFAPEVISKEGKARNISDKKVKSGQLIPTILDGIFSAKSIETPIGEFGYIRIFTFNVDNPEVFINEFIRLLELLPKEGLIVDVRGNGGGHIWASEGLLQVLTNVDISPEPTQFINTPLNLRICKRHESNPAGIDLGPWVNSIRRSVETGAIYSSGFPITPVDFANSKGQKYHGPVVLITDARCYSATDIFAAGFQDHEIGHILGVDDNTGAGGANVWTHGLLQQLLELPSPPDPETPYENLPNGANMRVAIRRTLRVGNQSGTPVEDLGVVPDSRHFMTKEDLLADNKDLINRAAEILKTMPVRQLRVTTNSIGETLAIQAETQGLTRLDTYIDGRPMMSLEITDGTHDFEVDLPIQARFLEFAGYENDEFVASRILDM